MIEKSVVLPAVFCLLLTGLCGCAGPLAMQGLSSTTPVAFNSTGRGKGDSSWLARYDDDPALTPLESLRYTKRTCTLAGFHRLSRCTRLRAPQTDPETTIYHKPYPKKILSIYNP